VEFLGASMRRRLHAKSAPACGRVGRVVKETGEFLAVLCLVAGGAFAALVDGSVEVRTTGFVLLGLMPALGFCLTGYILHGLLVLTHTLCAATMAKCVLRYAHFANLRRSAAISLSSSLMVGRWSKTISQWVHCKAGLIENDCRSIGLLHSRMRRIIFGCSCQLIRNGARFLIRIQAVLFSNAGCQIATAASNSFRRMKSAWMDLINYSNEAGRHKQSPTAHEIAVSNRSGLWFSREGCGWRGLHFAVGAYFAIFACGWLAALSAYWVFHHRSERLTDTIVFDTMVERIIEVESGGDANAKNKRTSATGLGQFLNETWLDLIRAYRPDLIRGRSTAEILELRRDPKLNREITIRFVERNAAMLKRRGLPVTPGTIYLAHFAGGGGAVAILSAPQNADAALVMASADITGRTKRENIIKANPFLDRFTAADLKIWADRKMRRPYVD